jgi:hypothetical protein
MEVVARIVLPGSLRALPKIVTYDPGAMGEVKLAALTTLLGVMVGCCRMLTFVVTVDPAARALMMVWLGWEPRVTSTKASP